MIYAAINLICVTRCEEKAYGHGSVPEKHIISQSLLVPLLPLFEFNDHCLGASSLEILKFSAFLDFSKSLTISRFDRQ